jgi:hypothetical protein
MALEKYRGAPPAAMKRVTSAARFGHIDVTGKPL